MKVLVVTESFDPVVNGVARSVRTVVDELTTRGHACTIVAPGPGSDRHGTTPVVRLPGIPLPVCRDLQIGLPTPLLRRTIAAAEPDVVHLASPAILAARAAVVARQLGLPTVGVFQTDLAGFATQYRLTCAATALWRYLRRVHGACDRTLAPSRATCAALRSHGVTDVHRWVRGVDLRAFSPVHRSRPRTPGRQGVRVGYVGRLASEKRLPMLRTLSSLAGVQLVIVGGGDQRARLERLLPDASFTGLLHGAALSRAYADLDLFVHPGRHETFAQSIQEALASGVPVVAAAAGGPLDLIQHGRTGLLFDPDEPLALREAVATLVTAPATRHAYAQAARASVADRSWAVIVDELEEHYRAVISGRARRTPDHDSAASARRLPGERSASDRAAA